MAVIKPKRTSTSGNVPTTSNLETGEIAVNLADKKLYVRDTATNILELTTRTVESLDDVSLTSIADNEVLQYNSSTGNWENSALPGGVDLGAVGEHILPTTTETYDLGSASKRFRDLYLSGNTINLAGATISSDGTGTISISSTGVTLPANSKVTTGNTTTGIALQGAAGEVIQSVPFYTKSGGLSTANANLDFRANTTRVVANFTLSDGTQVQSSSDTLFFL